MRPSLRSRTKLDKEAGHLALTESCKLDRPKRWRPAPSLLWRRNFRRRPSVVAASLAGNANTTNPTPDNPSLITIACSNGPVNCINQLNPQDVNNDARRLVLPYPIRWAHVTQCGNYDVIVAIPADADNRIVSYRTDWSRGEDAGDQYSLDELRALAEQTLTEGGRIG